MSNEQKEVYLSLMGSHHITKMRDSLTKRGYLNQWGSPFSTAFVSEVLHGKKRHEKVEEGIWAYLKKLVKEATQAKEEQDKLLQQAKSISHV